MASDSETLISEKRTFTLYYFDIAMKMHRLFAAFLLGVIALTMHSCAETDIAALQGRWTLFYVNHLDDPNDYVWEFANGGDFTITTYPLQDIDSVTNPITVVAVGRYSTTAEFLDAVVVISEVSTNNSHVHTMLSSCCMGDDSAEWTILDINDEVLRIGTPDAGGYVIREFTRES